MMHCYTWELYAIARQVINVVSRPLVEAVPGVQP